MTRIGIAFGILTFLALFTMIGLMVREGMAQDAMAATCTEKGGIVVMAGYHWQEPACIKPSALISLE